MVFPVVMYGCESWTIKKAERERIHAFEVWCWRRLLRVSPLDCKEIKAVNPKGNPPRVFIGRTVAEAGAPTLWPPDAKSQLTGKDPDPGKDGRQKEKASAEDDVVRQHPPGEGGGLTSLASRRDRHNRKGTLGTILRAV